MKETETIEKRIIEAERYWKLWDKKESPWPICQDAFLKEYERVLGKHTKYFAIDGDKWPPKALVRFDTDDSIILLTLGISLRPQPQVEMYYDNPKEFRRFEFGACFSKEIADETIMKFASYLSERSSYPWNHFTFFGNGHTLSGCDAFKDDRNLKDFPAMLLFEFPKGIPDFNFPLMDGEKVRLLWSIPLTEKERKFSEQKGSKQLCAKFKGGMPSWRIEKRKKLI